MLWQLTTTFSILSCLIMCLYVLSSVLWCLIMCLYVLSSVLWCLIMCLYVLSSVLWCLLRFPHKKRCSIHLYLWLFVGGFMSYLRYLWLLAHSGVQNILCCVFCCFSLACVHYVAICAVFLFDYPFGFL